MILILSPNCLSKQLVYTAPSPPECPLLFQHFSFSDCPHSLLQHTGIHPARYAQQTDTLLALLSYSSFSRCLCTLLPNLSSRLLPSTCYSSPLASLCSFCWTPSLCSSNAKYSFHLLLTSTSSHSTCPLSSHTLHTSLLPFVLAPIFTQNLL